MAVRVLTASSTAKLITLVSTKLRLGITDSASDSILGELIDDASSFIAVFLGRDLARQRYLETAPGMDRLRLLLSRYPVDRDSITLTIDDTADTDWSVEDAEHGILWRESGWTQGISAVGQPSESNTAVTYKAGYVLPDQIDAWPGAVPATAGRWVRPTTAVGTLLMECTTAGTMAASEPTWPTTAGSTVVSGTATFTARDAVEPPKALWDIAWLLVYSKHRNLSRAPGLASMSSAGVTETYFGTHTEATIPQSVLDALEAFRF